MSRPRQGSPTTPTGTYLPTIDHGTTRSLVVDETLRDGGAHFYCSHAIKRERERDGGGGGIGYGWGCKARARMHLAKLAKKDLHPHTKVFHRNNPVAGGGHVFAAY